MNKRQSHLRPFLIGPFSRPGNAHSLLQAELEDIRLCLLSLEQAVDSNSADAGDDQLAA